MIGTDTGSWEVGGGKIEPRVDGFFLEVACERRRKIAPVNVLPFMTAPFPRL